VHHNDDAAYISAQEAYDLEPSLKTALQLMPFLLQRQKNRKAKDILRGIWEVQPSIEITPFLKQLEENSSELNIYTVLKDWSLDMPDHPERSLILAECALKANLWGEARAHLNRITADGYHFHKNLLLADIEFQENHDVEKARLLYRQLLEDKRINI
jgi:HemY protein